MKWNGEILATLVLGEGQWRYSVHSAHVPGGQRHIHIWRKGLGEKRFSWNLDGSRHDSHRFPANEKWITRAKKIAAKQLGTPIDSLSFVAAGGFTDGFILEVEFEEALFYLRQRAKKNEEAAFAVFKAARNGILIVGSMPRGKAQTAE